LNPPKAKTQNKQLKRQAGNEASNETATQREFPNEAWIGADKIKLKHKEMPRNADDIIVAKGKLPISRQEELDFVKEIESAIILKRHGASVTLIPRIKRPDGEGFTSRSDAIVNGSFFEFKVVTGSMDKTGARYMDSREQRNNVYIRISNPTLAKSSVVDYLAKFVNNQRYQGGLRETLFLLSEPVRRKKHIFSGLRT